MFIKRSEDLDEKIISLVLFDTNRSFKWLCMLSLMKELFIEVSSMDRSHFVIFIFLQGKLCVSACISKSLAWTVFPCVEKMLSFGCVCSMKMRVSLVVCDKNQ